MTGLNLELFLRLARSDPGVWINSGIVAALIAATVWASHGRRRALRRCLFISLAIHGGLLVYGAPQAVRWLAPAGQGLKLDPQSGVRSFQLQLLGDPATTANEQNPHHSPSVSQAPASALPAWERPQNLAIADTTTPFDSPSVDASELAPSRRPDAASVELAQIVAIPEPTLPRAEPVNPREQTPPNSIPESMDFAPTPDQPQLSNESQAAPPERELTTPDSAEPRTSEGDAGIQNAPPIGRQPPVELARGIARGGIVPPTPRASIASNPNRVSADLVAGDADVAPILGNDEAQTTGAGVAAAAMPRESLPELPVPDLDPRLTSGAAGAEMTNSASSAVQRGPTPSTVPLHRAEPNEDTSALAVASRPRSPSTRTLPDVPEVYRSRVAPNRSSRAVAAGASAASEAAVERALAWLASHQDADGRWNAGTRPQETGRPQDTSFTAHCPKSDICSGECFYWEADTATTGLALLAFLGAGHTHLSGPYSLNVANGLNFLLASQKTDGDLRGSSLAVGNYCHSIAALALSEAYALTADERLRPPLERALQFLIRARSTDKQAWRYRPGDPANPETLNGDTSILGWAVMALKSGKEVGIPIPNDVRSGIVTWLNRVSSGPSGGLAMYRPSGLSEGGQVRPSMTAEAWVCRQFLGIGGPSPASDEAAAYLLAHGPDRDPYNLYYWYYATLALYQHGGEPWARWNARVRDQIVRRQVRGGHADGSWDPNDARDVYNNRGGRIYTTALATLTLEVYYRYLRLYDAPASAARPPEDAEILRSKLDPDIHDSEAPVPDLTKP